MNPPEGLLSDIRCDWEYNREAGVEEQVATVAAWFASPECHLIDMSDPETWPMCGEWCLAWSRSATYGKGDQARDGLCNSFRCFSRIPAYAPTGKPCLRTKEASE